MFRQGLELSSVRYNHNETVRATQNVNENSSTKINITSLGKQKCLLCTETEHIPDGAHKAVFTDHKTSLSKETHQFSHQTYEHMQLTQIKSHTQRYSLMYAFQFMFCTYVGITDGGGRNASNE